jgi:hypothetical protein
MHKWRAKINKKKKTKKKKKWEKNGIKLKLILIFYRRIGN